MSGHSERGHQDSLIQLAANRGHRPWKELCQIDRELRYLQLCLETFDRCDHLDLLEHIAAARKLACGTEERE